MKNIGRIARVLTTAVLMAGFVLHSDAAAQTESPMRKQSQLTVTQTAQASYTRQAGWSISASAAPQSWSLVYEDEAVSRYTVRLVKNAQKDSDFTVTGSVRIENISRDKAVITAVRVTTRTASRGAAVNCPSALPLTLQPGQTLECPYIVRLSRAVNGTARAFVMTGSGTRGATASARYTFDAPSGGANNSVQVSANGQTYGPYTGSASFTFDKVYSCQSAGSQVENVSIVETGQTAQAAVQVDCPLGPGISYESSNQTFQNASDHAVRGTLDIRQDTTSDLWVSAVRMIVASAGADTDAAVDCGYNFSGGSYRLAPGSVLHCTFQLDSFNPADPNLYGRITFESSRWLADGSRTPAGTFDIIVDPIPLSVNP